MPVPIVGSFKIGHSKIRWRITYCCANVILTFYALRKEGNIELCHERTELELIQLDHFYLHSLSICSYCLPDCLCGLVVLATDPELPGSIPGHYKEKEKVVGLERGPLSLVSTTEELLGRNNSGSGLEYGRRDSSR
jgi:hypothetical protein